MKLRIIQVLALLCLSAGFSFGQVQFNLTSTPNPSTQGQAVSLTATPAPSGTTVTFHDGGQAGPVIGSGSPGSISPGPVTISVSNLSVGQHSLIACYLFGNTTTCSNTVIQQVNNQTPFTLSSNPNPSNVGQAVTLTAGPVFSGTTVTFRDGGQNGTVIGSGQAAFTGATSSVTIMVSNLTAGTHQLIACYPGDGFSICTNTVNQVVNAPIAPTTLTFTSTPNPSSPCQSVTLMATVVVTNPSPGGIQTVTGSVTFFDGTTTLATVPLSGGSLSPASASFTVTAFTLGSHILQARYNPDPGFGGSSQTLAQTVSGGSPTATLSSSPNPSNFNQAVAITVTVAPAPCQGVTLPQPTGTVSFFDGTTPIGQGNVISGTATLSISTLAIGSHPLDARYNGDSNYGAVNSNTVTQVVNPGGKTNTTTTLGTSANPINAGLPLTLTANVSPSGATGQVQFLDGGNVIGVSTLSGGAATFTTSTLTAGSHSLSAVYLGDTNFNTSTSNTVIETVNPPGKTNTTTTLSASPNPSPNGSPIVLIATVAPSGATGQVQFLDGGSVIGTAPLSNGAASFTTSALSTGTHSLTASYLGDNNFNPSSSNTVNETVNPPGKTNTTTSLSATPNSAPSGQPVTLTAVVAPSGGPGGVPTGTVQFFDGGSSLGTAPLSNGTASISTSNLTVGTHSLSASYSGDANFNPSTGTSSVTVTPPINQPTSTSLSVTPLSTSPGQAVIMSAVVSPGTATGSVTFTDNGSTLSTVPLSSGTASFQTTSLTVGSHTIVATYNGSTTFSSSSSLGVTVVINGPQSQTTLSVTPTTSTFGQAVVLNATVSAVSGGGTPTGTVTFSDGNNTLGTAPLSGGTASFSTSALTVGTHSLTASYSGNGTFGSSSSLPVVIQVNKAATTTVVTPSPTSSNPGQAVTLTAKVTATTGNGVPTGTVTFLDGGVAIGSPVSVANGSASTTTSSLTIGTHQLTAVYSGDANFLTSTSPAVSESVGLTQTTTTLAVTPTSSNSGSPVTLTATVAPSGPTGTVTFMDGASVLGTQPLANGTATFTTSSLSTGPHSLTAVYSGDTRFATSTSTVVTETVTGVKTNSTTVLTATPNPAAPGQAVALRAVVTPATATGIVTFLDGTTTLGTGTLSNGAATFSTTSLSVGSHALTASYAGDANNNGSTSTVVTEVVTSPTPGPSNILPTSLPNAIVGVPYSQTLTATGGAAPLTWSLFSGSVPGLTLSQAGVLSGMPTTATTTPISLTILVKDANGLTASTVLTLTVVAAPTVSLSVNAQPASTTDTPIPSVTVGQAFPTALTAVFSLSFTSTANNTPTASFNYTAVQFASPGGTTATVTIPAGSTTAVLLPAVQVGSVAGTIRITLTALTTSTGQSVLPATPPTTTITVPRLAPTIVAGSVKIVSISGSGFTVTLQGTSTPRDLTSASLTFAAASGATLNGGQQTVALTTAATTWFTSAAGGTAGGAFTLTMPFTYSGDTNAISTVSLTLTNSTGTSAAANGGK